MDPDLIDLTMDPGLTIVLLGHSGVGKSATGNTILGRTAFESRKAFIPVTKKISKRTGSVFGKKISVIDTPAILTSEQEIRILCENIQRSSRRKLFLVVVKIDRFTKELQDAVEAAIRTVEDDGMKNSFMLFTNGDTLKSMSMSLDDFLNADPDSPLPGLVQRFAGTHVFNNDNGGQEQVRELLEKSDHLPNIVRPRGNREERRIVLLGVPGAGKSSAGNTILGSLDQFESDCSFDVVTTETVSESATVEGRPVTVVDTPGFTAKGLTPEKLYDEINKAIKESSPGPHAFVIVVSLGRITEAEIKVFKILRKLFCSDAAKQTVVLFTHGDKLGGRSIKDFIQANTDVPQGNKDVPQGNKDVPQGNKDVPQANTDVPQANTDVPQGNKDVPQGNKDVPQGNKDVPQGNKDVPQANKDVPQGNKDVPQGNKDVPQGNKDVPQGNKDVPQGNKDVPQGNKDVPQGNKDVPQGNKDVPQGNKDVPQGNKDVSQANKDVPQGNKDVSQANSCVSKLINMCGDRYCVFDNTKRGNRQQVKDLLSKIDEMIKTNARDPYTRERFYRGQTIPVKISIKWEWFIQKLREIDESRRGNNQYKYTKLD